MKYSLAVKSILYHSCNKMLLEKCDHSKHSLNKLENLKLVLVIFGVTKAALPLNAFIYVSPQ